MRILIKDITDGSVLVTEIRGAYYSDTITYANENDYTDEACVGHCVAMEVNDDDLIYVMFNSLEDCNRIIQTLYRNGMYDFTNEAEYTFIYPEHYSEDDVKRIRSFEKKSTENNKGLLQKSLDRMSGLISY